MELKFIGDRSGILGTIIMPEENCGQKNDKSGPKIDKNCAKIALFVLLKFNWLEVQGGTCPSAP